MVDLRSQLTDIGLARAVPAMEPSGLPAIALSLGNVSSQPVNRVGGQPNLPDTIEWPDRNGTPLAFIAQVDLASLPVIQDFDLPRTGSLFFFYEAGEMPWGFDPEDRGCSRVIYTEAPLSGSPLRDWPAELDEESRFRGAALSPQPEMTLPRLHPEMAEKLEITEEEWDAYSATFCGEETALFRRGGHPGEIQGDTRLEAQLVSNGIYCGDGKGYAKGRAQGLDAGAANWQLLLQVSSDHDFNLKGTGMMWGDLGRLYFLIHKDDLASRDFSKVWLILQCS